MARSLVEFQIEVMRRLLMRGRQQARDYLLSGKGAHTSKYLANEMQTIILSPTEGILYSDPYWALYFHDGRPGIKAKDRRLTYFSDPSQDPRYAKGYPHRKSQLIRLNLDPDEFQEMVKSGEIIVTKSVGPVAPTPYFSNSGGMAGFKSIAAQIIREEMDRYMQEIIEELVDDDEIELTINA